MPGKQRRVAHRPPEARRIRVARSERPGISRDHPVDRRRRVGLG